MKINLAILASGSGTNAQNLIHHFSNHSIIQVVLVVSNKPNAGVIQKSKSLGVPVAILCNDEVESAEVLGDILRSAKVDLIVLAGFLRKIPLRVIAEWPERIINIHPSLLPKFGGYGMYGIRVHQAVLEAGEPSSGISIHLVSEEYDRGRILFQAEVNVDKADSPESLALKIHQLEYQHLPAGSRTVCPANFKLG